MLDTCAAWATRARPRLWRATRQNGPKRADVHPIGPVMALLGLSSKAREDRWRCVCVGHDARWLPHDTTDLSLSLSALSVEMVHSYETPSWHAAGKHVEHSNSWPQAAFVPFSPPRSVAPINTSFFAIIRLKKQQRPARANKPTNDRSSELASMRV